MMKVEPNSLRQFGDEGWLLWRQRVGDTPQEGLLLTTRACASRECPCRSVTVDAWYVPESLAGVSRRKDGRLSLRFRRGHEPTTRFALMASVDIDTGAVSPVESAARGEPDLTALAWLREEMNGELLERLAQRFLLAKGYLPNEERWRSVDWSEWEPGQLIGWREVADFGREDLYVLDGRTYLADDLYCVEPTCPCETIHVEFFELTGEGLAEEHEIGVVVTDLLGFKPLVVERDAGDPDLVVRLGEAFRRRYLRAGILSGRKSKVRTVGAELLRTHQERQRAPLPGPARPIPARAAPTPGRNDPCFCGSGKKFKKCCLGRASPSTDLTRGSALSPRTDLSGG